MAKKVKARLVARGFKEDSQRLMKNSPTCTRESLRLLFLDNFLDEIGDQHFRYNSSIFFKNTIFINSLLVVQNFTTVRQSSYKFRRSEKLFLSERLTEIYSQMRIHVIGRVLLAPRVAS